MCVKGEGGGQFGDWNDIYTCNNDNDNVNNDSDGKFYSFISDWPMLTLHYYPNILVSIPPLSQHLMI